MNIGTFGGARLPKYTTDTNDYGFPREIHDCGIVYKFLKMSTKTRAQMGKTRAWYIETRAWYKPRTLLLSQREAYLLQ